MTDIELVIKIPEEMYKWVHDANKFYNDYGTGDFVELIKNGTPLPEGHGDLIDRSKLKTTDVSPEPWYSPMWAYSEWMIDDAEVVIPADKDGD